MTNSKYKTLLDNTAIFAIGTFGSKLITFLLVPLYTNILTKEQYGTADLVVTCSYFLVPIVSLTIQDSVLRFGVSDEQNRGAVGKVSIVVFLCGALVAILATPVIGMYQPIADLRWYLTVIAITSSASGIVYAYAKANNQNKLYAAGSIIQAASLAILNVLLLVVFPCGVEGYLTANFLGNLIPTVVVLFGTKMLKNAYHASFSWPLAHRMLAYSLPLILNGLSWWALSSLDRVLIEGMLSAEDLGLFVAASKLPSLLSVVTTIFSSAWTISSFLEYDSDRDKKYYANIFKYFSLAMFLSCAIVILISKDFMGIYVGEAFRESWLYVPMLLVGAVFFSFSSFFGAIYGAVKKNVMVTVTTVISAILNISVCVVALIPLGVTGASLATMVGYVSVGLIRMIDSRRYFSFEIDFVKFFVNSSVIVVQSLLVSFDVNIYAVSGAAILLVLVINRADITGLANYVAALVKNRSK